MQYRASVLAGALLCFIFVGFYLAYLTPWTKNAPTFRKEVFLSIAIGSTLDQAHEQVGNPFYGWKTGISAEKRQINKPILPANGNMLTKQEIIDNAEEDVRLTLFYSKPAFQGFQFIKYLLHFENGKLIEKQIAIED